MRFHLAALPNAVKNPLRPFKRLYQELRSYEIDSLQEFLLLVFSVPLFFLIRLLAPLIVVRVSLLNSARIGDLALEPTGYLADKDLGRLPRRSIDVFFYRKDVCNEFLAQKWRQHIRIWPGARYLYILNQSFLGAPRHDLDVKMSAERTAQFVELLNEHNHFALSETEEKAAVASLNAHGIMPAEKIICFFNRDAAYLNSREPAKDWTYHSYRDSKIESYRGAVETLTTLGYQAFRMGAKVSDEFHSPQSNVVDYATRFRSDLLDVYLIYKARFILATTCGLGGLCHALRKDMVLVNSTPFMTLDGFPGRRDLFLPKLYRSMSDGRLLRFEEILSSNKKDFCRSSDFSDAGLELIDNTPDEIRDVTLEMEQRLSGSWRDTADDLALHEKFNQLLAQNGLPRRKLPQIGTAFLRKYRALLD